MTKMYRAALTATLLLIACSETTAPGVPGDPVRRLAVSEQSACALDGAGNVFCWGTNSAFWEFGADPEAMPSTAVPQRVPVPRLKSLGGGIGTHTCGVTVARDAICWGRNAWGELGNGESGSPGNAAQTVQGGLKWSDIWVGRITTCGRTTTGEGYCWGINQAGEIGSMKVEVGSGGVLTPLAVEGVGTFRQIAAGWMHSCGIASDSTAYCWGSNTSGQLGLGVVDSVPHRLPEPVSGGRKFLQLALGSKFTCGVAADSAAYCWGENGVGQLGDETTMLRSAPTQVAGGLKFTQIATSSGFSAAASVGSPVAIQGGVGFTCALDASGKAYCWGWNGDGQLGDGTQIDRSSPTPVAGDLTLQVISLGSASTCGMRQNAVWCWGSNVRGQLGRTGLSLSAVPVAVEAPFR